MSVSRGATRHWRDLPNDEAVDKLGGEAVLPQIANVALDVEHRGVVGFGTNETGLAHDFPRVMATWC